MTVREYFGTFGKVLIVLLLCFAAFFLLVPSFIGYTGNPLGTANSNAKRVFTNTVTYVTKAGMNDDKMEDGAYYGVLYNKDHDRINCGYTGTSDDLQNALCEWMGGSLHEYYFVVIKDGYPVYAAWSGNFHLLEYVKTFTNMIENGEPPEVCERSNSGSVKDSGPLLFGGYPTEVSGKGKIIKNDLMPQTVIHKNTYADKFLGKRKFRLFVGYAEAVIAAVQFPFILTFIVIGIKKAKKPAAESGIYSSS